MLPLEPATGLEVWRRSRIDTVVLADAPGPGGVAGTVEALETAARSGVRKLVLRSSTLLYGPRPENPGFLPESARLRAEPEDPRLRGLLEVEHLATGLTARYPGLVVSLLRMAEVLGPGSAGPVAEYLRSQAVPTVMGFDPMVQLIHEEDAIEALVHAVRVDCRGPVNVAARPVLPLRRVVLLAGRVSAPILNPLTSGLLRLADRAGLGRRLPLAVEYLTYPCVADDRRMRSDLGFEPAHSAVDAIRDFAQRDRWKRSRR
ncbi:MAG: NAD-dependent epimerase/dehydratase family protein [Planctomycetes bacterium]|nr:NAD-dependent epimerase/dehydratase family protein [Planctomycetota bacterium]